MSRPAPYVITFHARNKHIKGFIPSQTDERITYDAFTGTSIFVTEQNFKKYIWDLQEEIWEEREYDREWNEVKN